MTGNSGWYLLGSGGVTITMVILLWGVFGFSLLLCLFVGIILCLGSVAYVFTLKNNKPEHYDTDFFESALVEAGVVQFSFGPRARRPVNPFIDAGTAEPSLNSAAKDLSESRSGSGMRRGAGASRLKPAAGECTADTQPKSARTKPEPVVTRRDYDRLQEKLITTEEMLEDVLAEAAED